MIRLIRARIRKRRILKNLRDNPEMFGEIVAGRPLLPHEKEMLRWANSREGQQSPLLPPGRVSRFKGIIILEGGAGLFGERAGQIIVDDFDGQQKKGLTGGSIRQIMAQIWHRLQIWLFHCCRKSKAQRGIRTPDLLITNQQQGKLQKPKS